jgi:hypothetical protein
MHLSTASPWPSRAAYVAAAVFVGASGAINLTYGWQKGTDLASSLTWAAVSLAVATTFALAWPALIRSVDARRWSAGLVALAALLLAGSYSITAALGSAAGSRYNAASTEQAATDTRKRAQAAYDQAQAALAELAPSRPLGEVEAALAIARPSCRNTTLNGRREVFCTPNAALTAERARAQRRSELQAQIERVSAVLASGSVRPANTDARALARYLSALGLDATPERLNDLLTLLAVVMIEAGGGLSLALGLALSERSAERPTEHSRTHAEAPNARPNAQRVMHITQGDRPASVADWLAAKGGRATVSMRRLAAELGCSPSSAHGELRRLALAGALSVMPTPRGTQIAARAM